MRLVTQMVGTEFDSRIWFTHALPLTLPLAGATTCSARAMMCAASLEIGGNTSSTSSDSNPACALPLKTTCAVCGERERSRPDTELPVRGEHATAKSAN